LLADSVVVNYKVTANNIAAATIVRTAMDTASTGTLTNELKASGYSSASASAQPKTANVSPTAPTMTPTTAPSFISSVVIEASCFAGSESISLESGEMIAISDVKVGDRLLAADASGKTLFSDVVYVPHGINSDVADFVHINTQNRDLKMTKNHIVPSGICGSTLPLVHAFKVSIGNCVQTVSGQEKVTSIEIVKGEGVYTVVTNEEYIIVNGIVASSFGANHMMANLYYNIHRFIYAMSPALLSSSLLHAANEGFGLIIPFFGPVTKL
jgi:hypothetical protein